MPCCKNAVKDKLNQVLRANANFVTLTSGLVDVHFHGAFGYDLMNINKTDFTALCRRLWIHGIDAFCPTTLSADKSVLLKAVTKLGELIEGFGAANCAYPIGIHLEGPFISPQAAGAHSKKVIRKATISELEKLRVASFDNIRLITLAPETLSENTLRKLTKWAHKHEITLAIGHSRASKQQAEQAFNSGFRSVTHAWNALGFHHREPGTLGAALGKKEIFLELIPDSVHLSYDLIRWMLSLHPTSQICFVSDAVPAAKTGGKQWYKFGNLKTRYSLNKEACCLPSGSLAGGGKLLIESFVDFLNYSIKNRTGKGCLLNHLLPLVTANPLNLVRHGLKLENQRIAWFRRRGKLVARVLKN